MNFQLFIAILRINIMIFSSLLFLNCGNSPLQSGSKENNLRLTFFLATPSSTSAVISWGCSAEADGFLVYGKSNLQNSLTDGIKSKTHFLAISDLSEGTSYDYQVFCGDLGTITSFVQNFKTTSMEVTSVSATTTLSSAQISWECSSEAEGSVSYGATSLQATLTNSTKSKTHTKTIANLVSNTSYIYQVSCNKVNSSSQTFITNSLNIGSITTTPGLTSATVIWTCSSSANGVLGYGQGSIQNYITDNVSSVSHSVSLTGLTQNTIYTYQVSCNDTTSAAQTFTTISLSILTITVTPSYVSTMVVWTCSSSANGVLGYGQGSIQNYITDNLNSTTHSLTIMGLSQQTNYVYQVSCDSVISSSQNFSTIGINNTIQKRGIWILGGIGAGDVNISQVDMYDPVADVWYPSITNIPTPRRYAGIVSNNGKIYVMGGINNSSIATNTVEEYDPLANTWKTMATMPVTLQGFIAASEGQDIYALGGTTTTDMTSGTILNTVYKFTPGIGVSGLWTSRVSSTAYPAKIDMGGCAIDGTIYFNTGRFYSDGSIQTNSDGYVISANTTTTLVEANFSLARFGAGSACYRPLSTDPYPTDPAAILVVGGSSLANTSQSPTSIVPSNRYDVYQTASTNTVNSGPLMPVSLFYPALEISYQLRKAYLFGGSSALNVGTNSVFSIDLANPLAGPWNALSTTMPVTRYGHKAVILSR